MREKKNRRLRAFAPLRAAREREGPRLLSFERLKNSPRSAGRESGREERKGRTKGTEKEHFRPFCRGKLACRAGGRTPKDSLAKLRSSQDLNDGGGESGALPVAALFLSIFRRSVLRLAVASDQSIGLAGDDLFVVLFFFPVFVPMNMMHFVVRSNGSPAFSMLSMLSGAVVSLCAISCFPVTALK